MLRSFQAAEQYIMESGIQLRVALCGAHDEYALQAILYAYKRDILLPILIGDRPKVEKILCSLGEDPSRFQIVNEPDEALSAQKAIVLLKNGEADIPMKGLMQSGTYLRAILNKETGILPPGSVLSECTVFEYPEQQRFLFLTDCAMNIAPGLEEKKILIKNAGLLSKAFLFERISAAALSSVEKVNPKIQSSQDAYELAHMDWPEWITVDGPLALDNAISVEAARHKGINSPVAGKADVLLVPDLDAGNILHKSLHFFAKGKTAGALIGTSHPVIFTSRTDSFETKYYSIITAILQAMLLKAAQS